MGRSRIEGNINSALVEIPRNVLPEIRKLQSGTGGVGKALAGQVAIATEIEDQAANGIRGIDAVAENRIPVRIALGGLILAEGF